MQESNSPALQKLFQYKAGRSQCHQDLQKVEVVAHHRHNSQDNSYSHATYLPTSLRGRISAQAFASACLYVPVYAIVPVCTCWCHS